MQATFTARQFAQNIHREFAVMERTIWDAALPAPDPPTFAFGDPVEIERTALADSNRTFTDAAYWFTSRYGRWIAVVLWLYGGGDPLWVIVPVDAVYHATGARLVDMPRWARS